MQDYMIRATAANDEIRAFAITSRELTEYARNAHNTSPIVTAALGRTLAGTAMMGMMMKGEDDLLTVQFLADGPIKGITVTSDSHGHVKGFAHNNEVMLPAKNGKLDVGGAVGSGIVRVIRDLGLKEPYVGTVDIQTGEIAEDLTYYFAVSEQTPSSVGLGVLMTQENTVDCAGGFIVQLMPEAKEETISILEENIKKLSPVTVMLKEGKTPEDMLDEVLRGLHPKVMEKMPVQFSCDCSRERVERSLFSLSVQDLKDIASDAKPVEIRCQFCNKRYEFSVEEIKHLLEGKDCES